MYGVAEAAHSARDCHDESFAAHPKILGLGVFSGLCRFVFAGGHGDDCLALTHRRDDAVGVHGGDALIRRVPSARGDYAACGGIDGRKHGFLARCKTVFANERDALHIGVCHLDDDVVGVSFRGDGHSERAVSGEFDQPGGVGIDGSVSAAVHVHELGARHFGVGALEGSLVDLPLDGLILRALGQDGDGHIVVEIDDLPAVFVQRHLGEHDAHHVLVYGHALHAYIRLRGNKRSDKPNDQHDDDGNDHQNSEHYLFHNSLSFGDTAHRARSCRS